jgi:transposase, IS30 family
VARRILTMADRAQIGVGIKSGLSDREIGELMDRHHTVIWRERGRNSTRTRGYRPVHADCQAQKHRSRPQTRKVDADPVLSARVRSDLLRSRTPRQIAGRLHLPGVRPDGGGHDPFTGRAGRDRLARGDLPMDLRPS